MDGGQRKVCRSQAAIGRGLRARLGLRVLLRPFQPGVPTFHGHRQIYGRFNGALGMMVTVFVFFVVGMNNCGDIVQFAPSLVTKVELTGLNA